MGKPGQKRHRPRKIEGIHQTMQEMAHECVTGAEFGASTVEHAGTLRLSIVNHDMIRNKNQRQIWSRNEEPALLLLECEGKGGEKLLLNEEDITPKLNGSNVNEGESNIWYIDNGASSHMSGQHSKFLELDEGITGQVRFGDGSTVDIK